MSVERRTGAGVLQTLPAEALFDVRVRQVTAGWARATMRLPGDTGRTSSLGWLGTLADVVTGRAIMALTPPNVYCQTVSLRLDVADRPPAYGEVLKGVGEVIGSTDAFALCQAKIQDESGQVVALGTARFALTRVDGADVADDASPAVPVATTEDLGRLLEIEVLASEPGHALCRALPSPQLGNQHGVVHGGVHAGFADVLLSQAVASASHGMSASLLDLTLTYHRPVPIDGTTLRMEGVVDRLGRRVAVASGSITSESGTVLTSVNGTFALTSVASLNPESSIENANS